LSLLSRWFGGDSTTTKASPGDSETVRRIVRELDRLAPERARYVAAFAFVLARVANADLDISEDETRRMEEILVEVGRLPEEQSVLAVQIAKSQSRLFAGTEDFLVTRELERLTDREQRLAVLRALFAVASADESVSVAEEEEIRRISDQLHLEHRDYVRARAEVGQYRSVLRNLPGAR
jgi:uncharacterized tellurite resistance protein B-like protein